MGSIDRRQFAGLALSVAAAPLLSVRRGEAQAEGRAPNEITSPPDAFFARLTGLMEVTGVPGVAMGVIRAGSLAWQRYEGTADVSTRRPMSPETLLAAASLGKPVLALAVLRLADEGKFDLDRPLRSYVPDHAPADPRGDKVTARHVLGHSTGYRNWRNNLNQPLVPEFDPGARFQYSGEGFYYLQRAVEKVSGLAFETFMEERLFNPLGMRASTYGWRADTEERLAIGHSRGNPSRSSSRDFANRLFAYANSQGKAFASFTHEDVIAALGVLKPSPPPLPNFLLPNAAGSLLTTLGDYARFMGRVLAPVDDQATLRAATRQQMLSVQIRINSALAWGLGWGIESVEGREYIWHWGDNGTYKNFVLAHVPSRSAILVFTNGTNGMRVAEAVVSAASGIAHPAFDWL